MFLHLCVILFTGGLASQHASQITRPAPRGVYLPTTETRKVGSMHPTGMLSCLLDKNSTKIHYFFSPVRLVSAMHIHMLDFCLS